jgi:heme A synthase
MLLFSDRSLLTMVHGLVLSGGAMMAMAAALFALQAMALRERVAVPERQGRGLAWLMVAVSVLLWLSVLSGTYVVFPLYRATPPEGIASLAAYPRALLMSNPDTRWLHAFGMEIKEHVPWIAAMMATAVAFVATRYRATLLADRSLRRLATAMMLVAFALVSCVALLGVFVNKIAPLE